MKRTIGFAGLTLVLSLGVLGGSAFGAPVVKNPALSVYARPQRLVALPSGRRINLDCSGQGSPTIILNPGLNGSATVWKTVKDALVQRTRVCAWDPPGLGWSDPSAEPQDAAHAAADLAAALNAAGISGPYVVVGHSAGGYVSLLFADRHRAEVAGMVLVDPSLPDQFAIEESAVKGLGEQGRQFAIGQAAKLRRCAAKVKAGGRLEDGCVTYYPEFPDDLVAALRRLDADPARLETKASIEDQFEPSSRQVVDPRRDYGTLPLIVLTAGRPSALPPELADSQSAIDQRWSEGHDALAALSRNGSNRIVEGAGHMIQTEKPQAVIAAVEEVLGQARSRLARTKASP